MNGIFLRSIIYYSVFCISWFGMQFYIARTTWDIVSDITPYNHIVYVTNPQDDTANTFITQLFTKIQYAFLTITHKHPPKSIHNGSFLFPFLSIDEAINYASNHTNTTIILPPQKITITDTLIIPENTTIYGTQKKSIIAKKHPTKTTMIVKNNTSLHNFTITGGNDTLTIPHNTNTLLKNITIQHAHNYGIAMRCDEKETNTPFYKYYKKSLDDIKKMPHVILDHVTVTNNETQGLYLCDGRVTITDTTVTHNGEEGIDLHPHMYATITNTLSSKNGESGLETEVYDNVIKITDSVFNNNTKSGIALITSRGTGTIILENNTITKNDHYGIRCAIHKNKPTWHPFFRTVTTEKNNVITENLHGKKANECFTF